MIFIKLTVWHSSSHDKKAVTYLVNRPRPNCLNPGVFHVSLVSVLCTLQGCGKPNTDITVYSQC